LNLIKKEMKGGVLNKYKLIIIYMHLLTWVGCIGDFIITIFHKLYRYEQLSLKHNFDTFRPFVELSGVVTPF
jgi:hypothetical protein